MPKKWRIYNIFYVLLLEQNITKKRRVDKKDEEMEFKVDDKEKYKVEEIQDSAVYAKKSEEGYLSKIYYLVFWKSYPKEKNTWELTLAVQYFRKLLNIFYKNNSDKPMAISPPINIATPIVWSTIHPKAWLYSKQAKQKCDRPPANNFSKKTKK